MVSRLVSRVCDQSIAKCGETGIAASVTGAADLVFDRTGHRNAESNIMNQEKMKQRWIICGIAQEG